MRNVFFRRKGKQDGASHKEGPWKEEEGIKDKTCKYDFAKVMLLYVSQKLHRMSQKQKTVRFRFRVVLWLFLPIYKPTTKHDTNKKKKKEKSKGLSFHAVNRGFGHGTWMENTFRTVFWCFCSGWNVKRIPTCTSTQIKEGKSKKNSVNLRN